MNKLRIEEQESGNGYIGRGEKSESNDHTGTARGDARPTGASSQRQELILVFEHCGVSVAGFEALRKDAYEKMIAVESPQNLEVVYEALLDPALGLAEVREKCPVWPAGSRNAGNRPSLMTLRDIKERILLDWRVTERLKGERFAKRLRREAPIDEVEFFETMAELLGTELITAKLDGVRISDNLRVFDRMLRAAAFKLRLKTARRVQEQSEYRMTNDETSVTAGDRHRDPKVKTRNSNDEIRNKTAQKETPKSNIQIPEKVQTAITKAKTAQSVKGNGLLDLVPRLDLGLGEARRFGGKKYDATVKSVAEKILGEMAVGGPS